MAKLAVCLMVDDPAPVVNPLYYVETQVRGAVNPCQKSGEPMRASIPIELIERFAELIERFEARGKFSVVPYPAGLGAITDGWSGADQGKIDRWLWIARQRIEPRMDITPEMLTHTLALDLGTGRMLPECERDWSYHQDEESLTAYITRALAILRSAGFDANGVTSPWDFGKPVEDAYAKAIRRAQTAVYNRDRSWFFLHSDFDPNGRRSYVVFRDGEGRVVSIVSKWGDELWQTMESPATDRGYIDTVADAYLDSAGKTGPLVNLLRVQTPIVFHTHWQSLYSNGRYTGLRALERVFERIDRNWAGKVEWKKCSELAEEIV